MKKGGKLQELAEFVEEKQIFIGKSKKLVPNDFVVWFRFSRKWKKMGEILGNYFGW